MITDNNVYYRRRKRSVGVRLLLALLILVAAVTAYVFIDNIITKRTLSDIEGTDYSRLAITFEKNRDAERIGYALDQRQEETLGTYEYVTPLGFSVVSQSEKWTGAKLVEVYEELLNNSHGDEITYISKIVIYPGASDIGLKDSNIAGTHSQERSEYRVIFDLPALLPSSMEYVIKSNLSVIELYNMDAYDDISQAARTISHEYGHHYTMFYFLQNDESAITSQYYTLRGVDRYSHDVFFNTVEAYYNNHEWSIYEIAAEDYVQLMGSKSGRRTEEYPDVYDLATSYDEDYFQRIDEHVVNVFPQENIYIPLADEIDGLRDYFYSFIGLENDMEPLGNTNFSLAMKKYTRETASHESFTYYEITWNKTSRDPDALYTLVCYDMDGNLISAVRTIRGDETPVARVGTYYVIRGNQRVGYSNNVTDEDRYFRLYLLLPDGRMQSSVLFYADF